MIKTLYKRPVEVRQYSFDFSPQPEIDAGETLSAPATIEIERIHGTGTLTAASPTVSSPYVHVQLSGGVDGDRFRIKCTVGTNASHTLCELGDLLVTLK